MPDDVKKNQYQNPEQSGQQSGQQQQQNPQDMSKKSEFAARLLNLT